MTLDEFLVKIGYDSDRVSLRRAKSDLNSLSSEAARVGMAFAGAFTAKKVTIDTSQAILSMDRLADKVGTTAQTIQSLSTISAREGGGFDAIAQQLNQIDFLRTQRESDLASMFSEFGITGLDPNLILNAESTVDAYLRLIDVINKTEDTAKKKQFVRLLQFDDSFLRMTQNSRKELESLIVAEGHRLKISEESVDSAKRFNDALVNSQAAVKNISTVINEAITPSIEQMTVKLNEMAQDPDSLSSIKSIADFISEHLEKFAAGGALLFAFSVLEKTARKIFNIIAATIALARKLPKIGRGGKGGKGGKGGDKPQGNKPEQGQGKPQEKPQQKPQQQEKPQSNKPEQGQGKPQQEKPQQKPQSQPKPDPKPDPNYKPKSDPKPEPKYQPRSDPNPTQSRRFKGRGIKLLSLFSSSKDFARNAVGVAAEGIGGFIGSIGGSLVLPGAGTAAGMAAGAMGGGILADYLFDAITEAMSSQPPVKQSQSLMDTSSINSGYINSMARDAVMQSVRPLQFSQPTPPAQNINVNNAITLELDGQVIDKRMNQLLIDTSNLTDDAIKSSIRG